MLLAECHGCPGADALVHQLGDIGRLQVPFLGDCPDTAPNRIHGMRAIALKTVDSLPALDIRKCLLCFLADFICHDRTAASSSCMTAWMRVSSHASRQSM